MAEIQMPSSYFGKTVNSVSALLENIKDWHDKHKIVGPDSHTRVWYRGHEDTKYRLLPGVYRDRFTEAAERIYTYTDSTEDKRLALERDMLMDFQTAGATLVGSERAVDVYFVAQHYGMPTRLLDWTTNPLAALFFAVRAEEKHHLDADLFLMDAPKLLPGHTKTGVDDKYPTYIVGIRHPYATDAIGESFWLRRRFRDASWNLPEKSPILPIRPDNRAGRIAQQSSCFTLHMHGSGPCENKTLNRIKVEGMAKKNILEELRKLNINEFSIYNDLDHLSKEVRRTRGLLLTA